MTDHEALPADLVRHDRPAAALGFGDTEGPVLGALKTGGYSNVVILAYTNPDKEQHGFASALRDEWEKWRASPSGSQTALSREKVREYVDAVSNTDAGHEIFRRWLQRKLDPLSLQAAIQILPQRLLMRLNDGMGIYNAAASAVRVALDDPDNKQVITYVSPGTPVMAYT